MEDKIHISKNKTLEPYSVEQDNSKLWYKPLGLWYAVGDEWIDWCDGNMTEWQHEHIFKLDIDMTDILHLNTDQKVLAFNTEYEVKDEISLRYMSMSRIDWERVAQEYKGIEISPYAHRLRLNIIWYYGWDVSSGCIWDVSCIKNVIKIK